MNTKVIDDNEKSKTEFAKKKRSEQEFKKINKLYTIINNEDDNVKNNNGIIYTPDHLLLDRFPNIRPLIYISLGT
jgi:hypothetical protein